MVRPDVVREAIRLSQCGVPIMGASRMGFDLRTRMGRRNLRSIWGHKAYRKDWKMIAGDTLMPIICSVIGHKTYDSNAGSTPELACKRCHKYVEAS